ncbi:copper chaperone PCu(A)C [Lysobacter sp. SG-8]|uniref:Copper chaperone PCu(A)C n=1 Tax=Marilutibacter penaei TaxID=2759900 RepID=A0A7W3U3E8_9GAMM|nr:copper chaperone PCu(A)C [Lysobacter penaei]MBB1088177.1 copper chaperone PCu(A)C [Lysobacter penaei]
MKASLRIPSTLRLAPAVLVACLALPGCADQPGPAVDSVPEPSQTASVPGTAPAAEARLRVDGAWIRAMAPGAPVAGGFMTLHNDGGSDDRLVEISTPDAARVEMHEMLEVDGVMQMRHLADGLPVAAGAAIELQPGSYHLMFIDPVRMLAEGDRVPATLRFEQAGPVEVEFEVLPLDTRGPAGGHHDHH